MGTGNVDVGNKTATRETGQPIVERLFGGSGSSDLRIDNSSTARRPKICGAMAQQCDSSGRGLQSSPQELIRLVGCREANARTATKTSSGSLKRQIQD